MSVVGDKSKAFAIRIIRLYKFLQTEKKEFVLSRQLLRSGTSIGANLAEADYAVSKSEFLSKVYIALKETAETLYWLELLYETDHLTEAQYLASAPMQRNCAKCSPPRPKPRKSPLNLVWSEE